MSVTGGNNTVSDEKTALGRILKISKWEIRRFAGTMDKGLIPIVAALFILLVVAMGFANSSGIHLEDNVYTVFTDSDESIKIIGFDSRFVIYKVPSGYFSQHPQYLLDPQYRDAFDLIVSGDTVTTSGTDRGNAALLAFERDYSRYKIAFYNRQKDLYAAYPVWIDEKEVESVIDFTATQMGRAAFSYSNPYRVPRPANIIEIPLPSEEIEVPVEELRRYLIADEGSDPTISRYTDILKSGDLDVIPYIVPSQMSASLPFDTIVLVFVFIFPLYFTSQFFMMSIMNERIDRRGEILLSTPVSPWMIIAGKALPYLAMMSLIAVALILYIRADLIIFLPLFPVILFFLSAALLIGMIARSFKELSFISIFFSTVASSYIFFPAIFANIHVISQISPLTLIIYQIQGDGFTAEEYLYSTIIFYLVSLVIFWFAVKNYNGEKLFMQHKILTALVEFVDGVISKRYVNTSLVFVAICMIPFVFLMQLMLLVLLFNFPMPLSLIMIMLSAALVEELFKSVGIYALFLKRPDYMTWKNLAIGAFAVAVGFLLGEKLLLFATLAEISESVFGAVMFSSLQVLWLPLILHFVTTLICGSVVKVGGLRLYILGIIAAGVVHTLYNLYFVLGVFG